MRVGWGGVGWGGGGVGWGRICVGREGGVGWFCGVVVVVMVWVLDG
jgi:hypothetical protein